MRLFSTGRYQLNSGVISPWIIDCRALSEYDWEALALIAMEKFSLEFYGTIGIPKGGLGLSQAMYKHKSNRLGHAKVLICDDVYTTGNSMNEFRHNPNTIGLVAFARVKPKEDWIHAIWTLND